jgi:hypothetical protein
MHAFYSVIEEIVEGFVEDFSSRLEASADVSSACFSNVKPLPPAFFRRQQA